MELAKALIVFFFLVIVSMVALKVVDAMAAWYTNIARPMAESYASRLNLTGEPVDINTSDYDVYERTKPYFSVLDIALVVAFLASILGIFIYNKERT